MRVVIVLKKRKFTFHGFVLGKFESMVQILLRNINFSKYFALFLVIFFFRHYFARHNRSVSIPFRKKKKKRNSINEKFKSKQSTKFKFSNYEFRLCIMFLASFKKNFISTSLRFKFFIIIFIVSVPVATFGGYVAVIDGFREVRVTIRRR